MADTKVAEVAPPKKRDPSRHPSIPKATIFGLDLQSEWDREDLFIVDLNEMKKEPLEWLKSPSGSLDPGDYPPS